MRFLPFSLEMMTAMKNTFYFKLELLILIKMKRKTKPHYKEVELRQPLQPLILTG